MFKEGEISEEDVLKKGIFNLRVDGVRCGVIWILI